MDVPTEEKETNMVVGPKVVGIDLMEHVGW
jgi:hypothetical protein